MNPEYTPEIISTLIQRMAFVRHAKPKQVHDLEEINYFISIDGFVQTRRLATMFGEHGLEFDISYSSPAYYAQETEDYTLTGHDTELVTLSELYPGNLEVDGALFLDRMESSGFATYTDCLRDGRLASCLQRHSEETLLTILRNVARRNAGMALNCIVFGHEPLLSGLICAFIKAGNASGSLGNQQAKFDSLKLGEGEGVSLRYHESPDYTGYWFEHDFVQTKP